MYNEFFWPEILYRNNNNIIGSGWPDSGVENYLPPLLLRPHLTARLTLQAPTGRPLPGRLTRPRFHANQRVDTRPANTAPPAAARYYYYYCDKVYPAEKIEDKV